MAEMYSIQCAICGASFDVPAWRKDSAKSCSDACRNALTSSRQKVPLRDRFWSKVNVLGPGECWIWRGSSSHGAAVKADDGKNVTAAAAAYALDKGINPRGLSVVQHCGNLLCCNPRHIDLRQTKGKLAGRVRIYTLVDPRTGRPRYVGQTSQYLTTRRAQHMCVRDGTPKSKWIEELVSLGLKPDVKLLQEVDAAEGIHAETYWIEFMRSSGESLTNEYEPDISLPRPEGSRKKISAFRSSLIGWRHSQATREKIGRKGEANSQSKLSAEQVRNIKSRLASGESQTRLAREFGVSISTVNDIALGRTWGHLA